MVMSEANDLMHLLEGTCSVTTSEPEPLTLDKLKEAKAVIGAICADDPLADYMREKGFDPNSGCLLLMPGPDYDKLEASHCGVAPYIRRSALLLEPVMVNPEEVPFPSNANA